MPKKALMRGCCYYTYPQREGFPNRADATKTEAGGDRGMCEV